MVRFKLTIKNATGLHLRPAGVLCTESMRFKSRISIIFKNDYANAKSVLSVLGACIKCGDEVEFEISGEDEEQAARQIKALVETGLGD